jgi:hypothetical protein
LPEKPDDPGVVPKAAVVVVAAPAFTG